MTEPLTAVGRKTEDSVPAWVTIVRVSGVIAKATIMKIRVWYLSCATLRPDACAAAAVVPLPAAELIPRVIVYGPAPDPAVTNTTSFSISRD